MDEEELYKRMRRVTGLLNEKSYELVLDEEMNNIMVREFGDRLEPAFIEVARRIGEAVSGATGRRVHVEFREYGFTGEALLVMSKYRLVDMDSGDSGEARIIGEMKVDSKGDLQLEPVIEGMVYVDMYGGEADRQVEQAIADRLSHVWIRVLSFREILEVVAAKYGDLLYEGAREYENYVRTALAESFDVDTSNVTVRLFEVEVDPERTRGTVHYLFRVRDASKGLDVAGRIEVSGEFRYLGRLIFRSDTVGAKYRMLGGG